MGRTSKRQKPRFAINASLRAKELGWNGHKVAEEARLSYPTVRDIMAGVSRGEDENKEAIARALGSTMSELFAEKYEPKPTSIKVVDMSPKELIDAISDRIVAGTMSVDEAELLRLFREGNNLRRETLLRIARGNIDADAILRLLKTR